MAFYTEGFPVGVISAGLRTLELLEAPEALVVGATWRFADRGYELLELAGGRAVVARTSGVLETIEARVRDGRLHPTAIRVASGSERAGQLILSFGPSLPDVTGAGCGCDPAATFAIAIDEHERLLSGRVVPIEMGFDLVPEQPGWAATRALHVELARNGNTWTLRSSIEP